MKQPVAEAAFLCPACVQGEQVQVGGSMPSWGTSCQGAGIAGDGARAFKMLRFILVSLHVV